MNALAKEKNWHGHWNSNTFAEPFTVCVNVSRRFWYREKVDFERIFEFAIGIFLEKDGLKSQEATLLEGRIAAYSSAT